MKYVIFLVFSVGLAGMILLLSFWRQGQATIFPHASFAAPTVAPSTTLAVMPEELLGFLAEYNPNILPLQPLYLPKMLWQRLELAFPRSKNDQQTLLLDRAQERMLIALYFWQQNIPQSTDTNILKSQQYLLRAAQVDVEGELDNLHKVQSKHTTILALLEDRSPLIGQAFALNQLVQSLLQTQ
jgi:hypothetical protein